MADQRSVLVVDDEDDIREGVTRWLSAAGYQVLTARNGEEGAAAAAKNAPDAILLDMLMPKLDGMQTLARLQTDAQTSRIPVVMLSASLRDQQQALDAGARFFVPKPYNGRTLLTTVSAAIDEKQ